MVQTIRNSLDYLASFERLVDQDLKLWELAKLYAFLLLANLVLLQEEPSKTKPIEFFELTFKHLSTNVQRNVEHYNSACQSFKMELFILNQTSTKDGTNLQKCLGISIGFLWNLTFDVRMLCYLKDLSTNTIWRVNVLYVPFLVGASKKRVRLLESLVFFECDKILVQFVQLNEYLVNASKLGQILFCFGTVRHFFEFFCL